MLMARRNSALAGSAPADISRDLVDTTQITVTKTGDAKHVNQFEVLRDLGKGSFGKVKLVKDRETGELFAMKVLNKSVLKKKRMGSRNMMQDVEDEIRVMKMLDHPRLVRIYEVMDSPEYHKIFLRMDFMAGGQTLPTTADGGPCEPLAEAVARRHFRDLLDGLEWLHEHGIVHRDIKPENLLKAADGSVKIADFGTAHRMGVNGAGDMLSRSAGTPAFTAPEACAEGEYRGQPADVWAAGVSLFMFTHGRCPFMSANIAGIYQVIRQEEPVIDAPVSADCRDLLARLLVKDPAARITIPEIRQHPWMLADD